MKKENKTPITLNRLMKITRKHKRNNCGLETIDNISSIGEEVSLAKGLVHRYKKFETSPMKKLDTPLSIRYDSGDLLVITKAKQLSSYIITITEKSPKKFRFSFVGKLHNACLELLEDLFKANIINMSNLLTFLKKRFILW